MIDGLDFTRRPKIDTPGQELVFETDLLSLNSKSKMHVDQLFLLAKEGHHKSVLDEYHAQRQATSRFLLGALLISEPILETVRRELRRLTPGVKIDLDEIKASLLSEVLKREVCEGDKFDEARRKISRALGRALRTRKISGGDSVDSPVGSQIDEPVIEP